MLISKYNYKYTYKYTVFFISEFSQVDISQKYPMAPPGSALQQYASPIVPGAVRGTMTS